VTSAHSPAGPQQFGNAEANLRFLDATGALASGVEVLEIGTGTGGMLHELRRRGVRARGVEINPSLIAESRAWFGDLPVQLVSGIALPFADQSFDRVLSFDVFEHIRDSDAHLREVARVLRPGGRYLVQTPRRWPKHGVKRSAGGLTRWRADHYALHAGRAAAARGARHTARFPTCGRQRVGMVRRTSAGQAWRC
jgi:SAM-dependent methyltransferase